MKFTIRILIVILSTSIYLSGQTEKGVVVKPKTPDGKRWALVIGNANYKNVARLNNTLNDSRDMRTTLASLGFTVTGGDDLSGDAMKKAIIEFGKNLKQGGVGLFYYSGHGIQANGRNYLIPTDASETLREETLEFDAVDVNRILAEMAAAKNGFNIVILDACRNNPFGKGWRDTGGGLAQIKAPTGTLIAYATAPDTTASDGTRKNGTYTEKLLQRMLTPNIPIEQVFKSVSEDVFDETNGGQDPWYASSLKGNFYFAVSAASGEIPANPKIENNQNNNQASLSNYGKKAEKVLFTFGIISGRKIPSSEIYSISDNFTDLLRNKLKEKGLVVLTHSDLTDDENSQYFGGINSRNNEKALRLLPVALIFNVTINVLEDMPQYQGMFISRVSGYIDIIDTENNKTIGNESFTEIHGFGNTQDQARRNALKSAGEVIPNSFFNLVKEKSR